MYATTQHVELNDCNEHVTDVSNRIYKQTTLYYRYFGLGDVCRVGIGINADYRLYVEIDIWVKSDDSVGKHLGFCTAMQSDEQTASTLLPWLRSCE